MMEGTTFEIVLLDSIDEALVKVFGSETSKSVRFYIDPNIALVDPKAYSKSLERMFKEGAKVVLDEIVESLGRRTGIPGIGSKSFNDAVFSVKKGLK